MLTIRKKRQQILAQVRDSDVVCPRQGGGDPAWMTFFGGVIPNPAGFSRVRDLAWSPPNARLVCA